MTQVSESYQDWLAQNSLHLAHDPVWRFAAYPKSLWLFDFAWQDCETMKQTAQSRALINQIVRWNYTDPKGLSTSDLVLRYENP